MYLYIYIVDIGSFDGDEMPTPPNDPGVDPDDDWDMAHVTDHEADANRPTPHGAPVPLFSRHRLNIRLRMELGDQLYALFVEARVRPATMRDI